MAIFLWVDPNARVLAAHPLLSERWATVGAAL
jgi:hypothetical protein